MLVNDAMSVLTTTAHGNPESSDAPARHPVGQGVVRRPFGCISSACFFPRGRPPARYEYNAPVCPGPPPHRPTRSAR